MSTVNLPSSHIPSLRHTYSMSERDGDIAKIRARMRELGYNQRSLSMAATGKEDTVRNLFRGLSQNWRGDNYKKVMAILWPEENVGIRHPLNSDLTEANMGLAAAIQVIFAILTAKGWAKDSEIQALLSYQMKYFQQENQPGAIGVLEVLIDSLGIKPRESKIEAIRKLLPPAQA